METSTRQEIYETVYLHLTNLYKHLYFSFKNHLTLQDKALISYQAYQEMIQMAQRGLLDDYFSRVLKGAI